MSELVAALVSFFLLTPLEDRIARTLEAAQAPQAVVREVTSCAREAAPLVADRVLADPWWGVQAAVRIWAGTSRPDVLLVETVPGCRTAIETARPFWRGAQS